MVLGSNGYMVKDHDPSSWRGNQPKPLLEKALKDGPKTTAPTKLIMLGQGASGKREGESSLETRGTRRRHEGKREAKERFS